MAVVVLILIIAGAGYYIYQQKQQMNDLVEAYDLDKQTLEDEFNELSMQYEGYQFKVGNDELVIHRAGKGSAPDGRTPYGEGDKYQRNCPFEERTGNAS